MAMLAEPPLLEVRDLQTHVFTKRGVGKAVAGASFSLRAGETLGLVGESGSGKSLACFSVLGLNPKPASRIVGGQILFKGDDLVKKSERELRAYRGGRIALVLQDPMTALNPVFTVGNQIREAVRLHQKLSRWAQHRQTVNLLERVHIQNADTDVFAYPHQFSGGMRQRVVSAIALAGKPELLIADEPTTALDVTVQAAYLSLLKEIQAAEGLGIVFVTHDFAVVARICDRVAVMYAGKVVESTSTVELFRAPKHPYTEALLKSVIDVSHRPSRLYSIDGNPPSIFSATKGCSFAPRCIHANAKCHNEAPPTVSTGPRNSVSCWRYVS